LIQLSIYRKNDIVVNLEEKKTNMNQKTRMSKSTNMTAGTNLYKVISSIRSWIAKEIYPENSKLMP
jgi:hypothetical protein